MNLACLLALSSAPLFSQETAPVKLAPAAPRVLVDTFVAELPGGAGGIEVDSAGNVYVADFGAQLGGGGGAPGTRVYKVSPAGEVAVFVDGLRGASGNAFGPDGAFYQSNIGGNYLSRVTPEGVAEIFLRQDLRSPVGIAVDAEGMLFVANCGSASIVEVTPEGESAVMVTDPLLACPNGITLDDEHNLYVSNFNNGDVIKVSWSGEVERLATLPGKNNGHLIFHAGFLYVVARGAHQIFRVSLAGEVELFAGSGKRGKSDGPALEASFSFPNDIAVAPDGKTFYVNENASTTEPHTTLAPMRVRRIRVEP